MSNPISQRAGPRCRALVAAAVATFALSAAAADFASSPHVTLRLSSSAPPGMEDSKALVDTAEYLKKATNGTVVLQPFFSSALFDEIAGMGAVQSGLVDMAVACTCNMTKQTDAYLFADVPYLWREMDNGRAVWNGPIGQGIKTELTQKLGMIPLAYTPSGGGYRILWNTRHPIKVPADVQGIKIRTTATPIEQEFWKGLGAVPTPVDVKEIYSALQQGLVDAEHLQPVWLTLLKHDEVVKYGTEIRALAVYRVLMISQKSYDKMDAAQKQAFAAAMKVYEDKGYEYNRALRETAMAQVAKRGIPVYEPKGAEMKLWEDYGAKFMASDVVRKSVNQATLEAAIKAQRP
ncbi:MAG: TRAP transporter substrate-binding protein [Proteobacteria bacterium]|nr:TRAP transporter substrate-binding protein [Pseudomonadota bacterium]